MKKPSNIKSVRGTQNTDGTTEKCRKKISSKVFIENEIAAVFNIQTKDEKNWRGMDLGKSFYLHGVLLNPKHKGKRIFGDILTWTLSLTKKNNKENIRLDTWHNNPDLISYYKTFGFYSVEDFQIQTSNDIAFNCRGNKVTLMEFKRNNKC